MENKQIGIGYGIMCDPISEQLKAQGFSFKSEVIKGFEKELQAVHTLRFGSGLLTESTVDKIFKKLHKKVVSHVIKENKN